MAVRESQVEDDEPIIERTRNAVANGNCIRANLTREGRDILNIEPQDELQVQVFHDHIRIYPEE